MHLSFAPGNFIGSFSVGQMLRKHGKNIQNTSFERLADGTLLIEAFKCYLIQDYLHLIQFALANMLTGRKRKNFEDIVRSVEIVLHISHEMSLHLEYCAEFGLSKVDNCPSWRAS